MGCARLGQVGASRQVVRLGAPGWRQVGFRYPESAANVFRDEAKLLADEAVKQGDEDDHHAGRMKEFYNACPASSGHDAEAAPKADDGYDGGNDGDAGNKDSHQIGSSLRLLHNDDTMLTVPRNSGR